MIDPKPDMDAETARYEQEKARILTHLAPSPYTVDARIAALQETITVLTERLTRLEGEWAAWRRWITARVDPPAGRSRP